MRDLDAFLDRALEDRPGEPDDAVPVSVLEPVPVLPVVGHGIEPTDLDARRKQLDTFLEGVLLRGGLYELADFWSPGPQVGVWPWEDPVREEAVDLMLDDRLAPRWAGAFGVPEEQFRLWREVAVEPHEWLGVDLGHPVWVQCTGTTRAGKRCKHYVPLDACVLEHPANLEPEETYRCKQHVHKERGDVAP